MKNKSIVTNEKLIADAKEGDYVYIKKSLVVRDETIDPGTQSMRYHGKVIRVNGGILHLHTGETANKSNVVFLEMSGEKFPLSAAKRRDWICGKY